jgi:hypothetical protein
VIEAQGERSLTPLPFREGSGVGRTRLRAQKTDCAWAETLEQESFGSRTLAPTPNPSLKGRGIQSSTVLIATSQT